MFDEATNLLIAARRGEPVSLQDICQAAENLANLDWDAIKVGERSRATRLKNDLRHLRDNTASYLRQDDLEEHDETPE